MLRCFFDLETTGLPEGRNAHYTDRKAYEKVHIVSIAIITQTDHGENNTVESEFYSLVKPDFAYAITGTHIHGITEAQVMECNFTYTQLFDRFEGILKSASYDDLMLICHNTSFDINVLASAMYRRGYHDLAEKVVSAHYFCTMRAAQVILETKKWLKLQVLYEHFFGKPFDGAHNALNDVRATVAVYHELKKLISVNKEE